MGDEADAARDAYFAEELEKHVLNESARIRRREEQTWRTQDRRAIPIREMSDQHLLNAISFLERRGLHPPEEVASDVVAAAEDAMCGYGEMMRKKYSNLLRERKKRQLPTVVEPCASPSR